MVGYGNMGPSLPLVGTQFLNSFCGKLSSVRLVGI